MKLTTLAALLLSLSVALAAEIPSPEDLLGADVSQRGLRHAEIVRYVDAVAATSPRVSVARYGQTHQGRDLLLVTIAREDRLGGADLIAARNRELADPTAGPIPDDHPLVAFMAYSVHGDEFSGADAGVRLIHHLATDDSDATRHLLDNLIVLVDPLQNPDGRERILAMSESFKGRVPNPDRAALSHSGFWPWGRTNHYFFDLNRDWFSQTQPEVQGRVDILRQWRPQLVVDGHEMGSDSTYLFNPPRAPFNPLLPSSTRAHWDLYAAGQAEAFDREGWSYYTREWNEEFFPGYGSSFPLYQGAMGILYEQASTNAQDVRTRSGKISRWTKAVARQFTSSMANLETAATNRVQLLAAWRAARIEAIERGRSSRVKAYYLSPDPDPARARRIAAALDRAGVLVETNPESVPLRRAHDGWGGAPSDVIAPAGAYRIRLDQPDGLLASVILAPHLPMPDSFLAEQREHFERDKGSRVYDTTAWSPLLASAQDWWWLGRLDAGAWERYSHENDGTQPAIEAAADEEPRIGWLISGQADRSLGCAADLLAAGLVVRTGEEPVQIGDEQHSRGALLVRVDDNRDVENLQEQVTRIVVGRGLSAQPLATALMGKGPDLGGGNWPLLVEPRIGLVAGSPVSPTAVGGLWHLLDNQLGIRVSLLDAAGLGRASLDRYNVIVLTDAWRGYSGVLGDGGAKALRSWVERGGTLIAIDAGAEYVADEGQDLGHLRRRRDVLDRFPAARFGLDDAAVAALERPRARGLAKDGAAVTSAGPYDADKWPAQLKIPGVGSPVLGGAARALLGRSAPEPLVVVKEPEDKGQDDDLKVERRDARLRRFMPSGAILRVDLDPEHWLSWGVGDRVPVMARTQTAWIAEEPVTVVGRYASPDELHLGGLLWPEAVGRISHTAWVTREGRGRGQIVSFATDPAFRGWFAGTARILANAAVLGPGLGARRTIPW